MEKLTSLTVIPPNHGESYGAFLVQSYESAGRPFYATKYAKTGVEAIVNEQDNEVCPVTMKRPSRS